MNAVADDSAVRADDLIVTDGQQPAYPIAIVDKLTAGGHNLPEQWLRARVRGWMELNESPGLAYWVGTYTSDGKWIWCSSRESRWTPAQFRVEFAMKVCKHLNRMIPHGGAWLTGWVQGGRVFYMLWKDRDGDIQIPIECDKPFVALRNWAVEDFERLAGTAWATWLEWKKRAQFSPKQQKMVAQGEPVSPEHLKHVTKIDI